MTPTVSLATRGPNFHLMHGSFVNPNSTLIHFCRANGCVQQTGRHTHRPEEVSSNRPHLMLDWLSCGFTCHLTRNRSFHRRFDKPISWLGMEKTKPNTTKASIHQSIIWCYAQQCGLMKRHFCEKWELAHTHTHPFNGSFLGLPGSAATRKVKPIWILMKQETVSGSGISWAICKSALRSRQITMPAPHHSAFTGRMPFLPPNQQHQSTEGNIKDKLLPKSKLFHYMFTACSEATHSLAQSLADTKTTLQVVHIRSLSRQCCSSRATAEETSRTLTSRAAWTSSTPSTTCNLYIYKHNSHPQAQLHTLTGKGSPY